MEVVEDFWEMEELWVEEENLDWSVVEMVENLGVVGCGIGGVVGCGNGGKVNGSPSGNLKTENFGSSRNNMQGSDCGHLLARFGILINIFRTIFIRLINIFSRNNRQGRDYGHPLINIFSHYSTSHHSNEIFPITKRRHSFMEVVKRPCTVRDNSIVTRL